MKSGWMWLVQFWYTLSIVCFGFAFQAAHEAAPEKDYRELMAFGAGSLAIALSTGMLVITDAIRDKK